MLKRLEKRIRPWEDDLIPHEARKQERDVIIASYPRPVKMAVSARETPENVINFPKQSNRAIIERKADYGG
ncbi:hypothetical protein L596_017130 [Steinernema carpocapsae]|uniref:Uncharacterized protein n=1 Tax=Steinernema carpocapsae TaxID=34508 RepID=A0A4U5N134_STECR|nr:hypothetical protein L596_017130 [Steinernema carpocapsae]